MSDDEEILLVKKQKTIHYGSLEETERARLAAIAAASSVGSPSADGSSLDGMPVQGTDVGNINISDGMLLILYTKTLREVNIERYA